MQTRVGLCLSICKQPACKVVCCAAHVQQPAAQKALGQTVAWAASLGGWLLFLQQWRAKFNF
jgi:hypothetical protein